MDLDWRYACRMVMVRLRVEFEEVPGRGWVVHSPEAHATAQGETREEALANLRSLFDREVLDEFIRRQSPELELIPA